MITCWISARLKNAFLQQSRCRLVECVNLMAMSFQGGMAAYQCGDFAKAMRYLRSFAYQGDATAQFYLGLMYHNGQGVSQDEAAALSWYAKPQTRETLGRKLILHRSIWKVVAAWPKTSVRPRAF
jgi:hypothetical protein